MNDRQVEQALSQLYSVPVEMENIDTLADKVWKRNRRHNFYLNCAVFGAALLGCSLSYLVIDSFGPLPAIVTNLDIQQFLSGSQWVAAVGIPVALIASLWASSLVSE